MRADPVGNGKERSQHSIFSSNKAAAPIVGQGRAAGGTDKQSLPVSKQFDWRLVLLFLGNEATEGVMLA